MKKTGIALILILGAFFVYGQNTGPIDLILLLDTSASMSDSYEDVHNYISGAFLREFLRIGDTFHLIPFSDKPRVDFARRFEGRGELETIIGRMFLQYPLDLWSDIPAALNFAESYAASLPSRPKKIVLVSDGEGALPPGSDSRSYDDTGLGNLINETKIRLGRQGIDFYYARISPGKPLVNMPGSERAPLPRAAPARPVQPAQAADRPASQTPDAPPPAQAADRPASSAPDAPPAQAADRPASQTPDAPPPAQAADRPASSAPDAPPAQAADRPASQTPDAPPPAQAADRPVSQTPDAPPSQDQVTSPAGAVPTAGSRNDTPSPAAEAPQPAAAPPVQAPPAEPAGAAGPSRLSGEGLPLLIGIAVLGLLVAGLIIFLVTRRIQRSPNRAMAMAAVSPRPAPSRQASAPAPEENLPPFKDHSKDLADFAASRPKQRTNPYADHRPLAMPVEFSGGPVLLNLFVEDQNTFIGKRNIHALKSGYSFTIGGGKSDFLIFLVPVPAALGEVRRDGNRCTFIPRKPEYFPDLGSRELPDCIGKTIRIISDKHYELRFRIERYEDPLIALNRLLNSIKVPGLVK